VGHEADRCPTLRSLSAPSVEAQSLPAYDLARAFYARCHVNSATPDWFVDTGATDHMTTSPTNLQQSVPFSGDSKVMFGNGNHLPISHVGHTTLHNNICLNDILVVPKLTNNLLSVSKLTQDNPLGCPFLSISFLYSGSDDKTSARPRSV
jgi:hypothetical protein